MRVRCFGEKFADVSWEMWDHGTLAQYSPHMGEESSLRLIEGIEALVYSNELIELIDKSIFAQVVLVLISVLLALE